MQVIKDIKQITKSYMQYKSANNIKVKKVKTVKMKIVLHDISRLYPCPQPCFKGYVSFKP